MDNIFEQASRVGLRFDSSKGQLSVEDLWDLPLQGRTANANLDDIARGLHRAIREQADAVSFVNPTSGGDDKTLELKFAIVKHIINVRVAENNATKEAAKRRESKQRLLEIIERKKGEALEGKSLEELEALAASM